MSVGATLIANDYEGQEDPFYDTNWETAHDDLAPSNVFLQRDLVRNNVSQRAAIDSLWAAQSQHSVPIPRRRREDALPPQTLRRWKDAKALAHLQIAPYAAVGKAVRHVYSAAPVKPIVISMSDVGRSFTVWAQFIILAVAVIITDELASRKTFVSGYFVIMLLVGAIGLYLTGRAVRKEFIARLEQEVH